MEVAGAIAVLFFVIVVVGALFGGRSFGGVIVSGILGLIFIGVVIAGLGWYGVQQEKEELKTERQASEREDELKQQMLESLSIEDKKSTDENYVRFVNDCGKPISLHVYYLNTSGNWKGGLWEFDGNEGAYLSSSNGKITSNNSILYYLVESQSSDNIEFSGTHKIKYSGRSYSMKKLRDEYDSTEWTYSCK